MLSLKFKGWPLIALSFPEPPVELGVFVYKKKADAATRGVRLSVISF
jgi:hypothetical protein